MKLRVKVEGQEFEVEVGDLSARPIVAVVEGQTFEVWPEEAVSAPAATQPSGPTPGAKRAPQTTHPPRPSRRTSGEAVAPSARAGMAVYAPLPGVIESIVVRAGDVVVVGQELCVLEAMKMKNIIRAPRAGQIAGVRVALGEHVKHNDLLFEYAE